MREISPTPRPTNAMTTNIRMSGLEVIAPTYSPIQPTAAVTSSPTLPMIEAMDAEAAGVVVGQPSFQREICIIRETSQPVKYSSITPVKAEIGGSKRTWGRVEISQRTNSLISCISNAPQSQRQTREEPGRQQRSKATENRAESPERNYSSRSWDSDSDAQRQ